MLDIIRVATLLTGILTPSVEKGMATFYNYQDYGGGPLYASKTLYYNPKNKIDWCAVNVASFQDGSVLPGDILLVHFLDGGDLLLFEAWDAGPFDGFYLEERPNLPILIDIPQHLWPLSSLSAEIEMINLSEIERMN